MDNVKPKFVHVTGARGRPAKGRDPFVGIRLPGAIVAAVDAISQADGSTRSGVIRQAVEREIKRRSRIKPLYEPPEQP